MQKKVIIAYGRYVPVIKFKMQLISQTEQNKEC